MIESSLINSNILTLKSISGPLEIRQKGIRIDVLNYINIFSKNSINSFAAAMTKKLIINQKKKIINSNKKKLKKINYLSVTKLKELFN